MAASEPANSVDHKLNSRYRDLALITFVGLLYWATAQVSLNFALVHGQVTPIWPPTGIAVVAILLLGRRVLPAIALAAFAVNLPIGPSPLGAAVIAVGNTLAPLASAELLKRAGFHLELDRPRDAAAITFLGALAGMTVSATIGSSVLTVAGTVTDRNFLQTWAVWWTGDAMGVLLVAPFLLSLLPQNRRAPLEGVRGLELLVYLLGTAVVTGILFQNRLRLEYLVFPLIMLTAWRFRLRGAAPAALVASIVAIWAAVRGDGPFAGDDLLQKMVTLQTFNVSLALASFVLTSFVEAQQRKEELDRLYAAAQLTSQAKSAFLNMAAHELKTPIAVLSGYLSMLTEGSFGVVPSGWHRPLEILTSKTRELNATVNSLLLASRLESEALPLDISVIDLRDVVKSAAERLAPRADLLRAEVRVDLAQQAVLVKADPLQLGKILDNLLNNALTYTLRSPRVSVAVSSNAGQGEVTVSDNGVGIKQAEREKVFERFHRSPDPAFSHVAGTGLGLYIARELARSFNGSLELVSSEPGNGSVFRLSLPLSPIASSVRADRLEDFGVTKVERSPSRSE